jgi:hypothetical protein
MFVGPRPDRFLIGLAVLSLFAEVAVERPLLCVVDDAQWLDRASAQALGLVARRLLAESVAVLIATREPSENFSGLPELVVERLPNNDARDLLDSVMPGPLDESVRERIVAETRGNPLALPPPPSVVVAAGQHQRAIPPSARRRGSPSRRCRWSERESVRRISKAVASVLRQRRDRPQAHGPMGTSSFSSSLALRR